MYCIVVGGGKVGYYLTKDLAKAGHEVVLLEKDRARAGRLTEELGELVIQGDGCEAKIMEAVGFGRADMVIAVTGEDEDNLVVCQMAKKAFDVPRTIARVNSPANEPVFAKLGIDTTVSATRLLFNLIEQEVESDTVIPLAALSRGNLEIVEIELSDHSPVVGKTIAELYLPAEGHIMALIREEHGIIPNPTTQLEVGDLVLALVETQHEAALRAVFH
jgi:trk system potassium uptake protein TrkA